MHAEVWPDVMMVRYCLCCVVRPVSVELAQLPDTPFKPSLRRSLFDALSLGSEEGSIGKRQIKLQFSLEVVTLHNSLISPDRILTDYRTGTKSIKAIEHSDAKHGGDDVTKLQVGPSMRCCEP